MIKYIFKEGIVPIKNAEKANPQRIGEAIAKIAAEHGGRFMPEHGLLAAKDPKHPFHPHLEWNDKVAAHAHRMDQMRQLVRLVATIDEATEQPKPAFISISDDGTAYRTVNEVENSAALQLQVLKQALRDLQAFETRYRMLQAVCTSVRAARERVQEEINNLETRAAA